MSSSSSESTQSSSSSSSSSSKSSSSSSSTTDLSTKQQSTALSTSESLLLSPRSFLFFAVHIVRVTVVCILLYTYCCVLLLLYCRYMLLYRHMRNRKSIFPYGRNFVLFFYSRRCHAIFFSPLHLAAFRLTKANRAASLHLPLPCLPSHALESGGYIEKALLLSFLPFSLIFPPLLFLLVLPLPSLSSFGVEDGNSVRYAWLPRNLESVAKVVELASDGRGGGE